MKRTGKGGGLEQTEHILSELHQTFARRIYFFALREFRSQATAEDVCHETLMRVVKAVRAGNIESQDALPGFVAGTARNVIREFRRDHERAGSLGDRDFPAPETAAFVDPPLRQAIEKVFQRLKPRERDVLRLYYYEEQSKEEIALRLGIDPERVRLVKSRALKSFREFYLRVINPGKQT